MPSPWGPLIVLEPFCRRCHWPVILAHGVVVHAFSESPTCLRFRGDNGQGAPVVPSGPVPQPPYNAPPPPWP
jgi:hypothetical protein